jgi:hypothetical protein
MCAVTPDVCRTHGSPCAQMAHTGMPLTHIGPDVCHAVDPEIFWSTQKPAHISTDVSHGRAHMGVPMCTPSVCSVKGTERKSAA